MKKNPWLVLLAVYLVSIGIVMTMFKVPPVMPVLIGEFQLDMVAAGWLMSIFTVTAVILAFPAAFVLKKLGPKNSGLISIGCAAIGSLVGYAAPNFEVLMLSRVIEGVGLGMMAVIAPAVITMSFPPDKRGLPIGIWSSWFPAGMVIIFAIGPTLAEKFGRQGLWLFTAAFAVIAMIAYALFVSDSKEKMEDPERAGVPQPRIIDGLKFSGVWILALGMLLFNIAAQAYANWAPTYFITILNVAPVQAGFYMSLMYIVTIVVCVFAGWITDKIPDTKYLLMAAFAALAILWIFAFRLNTQYLAGYVVLYGIITPFVPTVLFTMIPKTLPNMAFTGIAMATVNLLTNIGVLISAPAMGFIIQKTSWPMGASLMVGAAALGAVATLFYRSAAPLGETPVKNKLSF